jgi:hypothetical protein
MGSSKDVMELFAERDIRQYFSEYEGWKIEPMAGFAPEGRLYRTTRGRWAGVETVYIAVSFDPVPQEEFINAFSTLPDGRNPLTRKYLLTPQATDTSVVPPHIRILLMNAFAFSGGNLVWLTKKKNAAHYFPEESAPAAKTAEET